MLRADASWGSSTPLVYDPARGTYTGAIAVSSSLARGVYQITVLAVLTDDGLSPKTFTCKADIVAGGALPIEDPASPSTPYRRPDLPLEIRLKRLEPLGG
jgi:hypothetical protein